MSYVNGVTHRTVRQPRPESIKLLILNCRGLAIDRIANVNIRVAHLGCTSEEDRLIAQRGAFRDKEAEMKGVKGISILLYVAKGAEIGDLNPVGVVRVCAWCHVTGAIIPAVLA